MTEQENRTEELRANHPSVWQNEATFRAVLRDIKERFPGFVPESLDPKGDLDYLVGKYFNFPIGSRGFGIGEFEVGSTNAEEDNSNRHRLHTGTLEANEAVIEIHNFAPLSGRNHILLYEISPDNTVRFKGEAPGIKIMS